MVGNAAPSPTESIRSESTIVLNSANEKLKQAEMLYKYLEEVDSKLKTNDTKQMVNKGNSIYKQIETATNKIVELNTKIQQDDKYDQLLVIKQEMMVEAGKIDTDIPLLQELYGTAEALNGATSEDSVEEEF